MAFPTVTLEVNGDDVTVNTLPDAGQGTMANTLGVNIASDQSAVSVAQSGTWTVQVGNTPNTSAILVDGSGVTQPVSIAAPFTLPTGASTNVTGAVTNPTSNLVRPADTTAYALNDFIGSSTVAASCVVPSFVIANSAGGARIGGLMLKTSATTGWGTIQVSVNLWRAAPTYTTGDNATYTVATGAANWIGNCLITLRQFGDGAIGRGPITTNGDLFTKLASGTSVFWDLEITTGTPTPISSQTFTLTAELLN